MTMSINGSIAQPVPAHGSGHAREQLSAGRDLKQALASGDLDGAKSAFETLAKNAPQGANFNGGNFAQLGKALRSGDIAGAQAALSAMGQNLRDRGTQPVPPTASDPVVVQPSPSSTGGVAGAVLNVQA
jgi:hypothetical protein